MESFKSLPWFPLPRTQCHSNPLTKLFHGKNLSKTTKEITRLAPCALSTNQWKDKAPSALTPSTEQATFPGEDWQLDFTQIPPSHGYQYLLVFIDTFARWIEAFPTWTERASEVAEVLLKETTPRSRLPQSLQGDNGPSITVKVTQGLSQALGINCHLHASWRSQPSGRKDQLNFKENSGRIMPRNLWDLAQCFCKLFKCNNKGKSSL